jgi:rod shape-determining protein MreC
MAYGFLAGLLMLLDQRGEYIPRLRALAEQVVSPVYQVAEAPVEAVRSISTYGQSFEELLDQNEAQRERLLAQAGAMQRLAALEEENRRLRALLDATEGRNLEFRFAELIQVSLDPNSHQVLIDRGEEDGVFVGQAVIDGQGVMGQVESTTGGQARVRLISDPEHAIPVQILRTGQRTVALGTGEPGRLSMPNLPMQSDVRVGDRIVTSGLGERFPAGFPVAEVAAVDRPPGAAFMNVDALPLATLDRGREVLLVLESPGAPLEQPDAVMAQPQDAREPAGDLVDRPEDVPEAAGDDPDGPGDAPEQAGDVSERPGEET